MHKSVEFLFSTLFVNMMGMIKVPSSPRDSLEIQRRDSIFVERATSSGAAKRSGGQRTIGGKNVPTGSPHASPGVRSPGEQGDCACD
jgi:hypothetical protein